MTRPIPGAAEFAGRRIAILGLGISGRASATALVEHTKAVVSCWDARETAVAELSTVTTSHGQLNEQLDATGAHAEPRELIDAILAWSPDTVVIAPAFRQTGPEWEAFLAAGVPVWSEIELAWHLRATREDGTYAPWLCITGTNGKTTTVSMLAAILQEAGLRGVAVGNVGTPAVTAVSDTSAEAPDAFAFELSSFQLAATHTMEPEAAICLNLADDHLEWHRSREEYRDAKASIYERVRTACLFPVGDSVVQAMVDGADVQEGARAIGLSLGMPQVGEIGLVDDLVADRAFVSQRHTSAQELFTVDDLTHLAPGRDLPLHLMKDALAAAGLARAIGVDARDVKTALQNFNAGKHRIEHVATVDGVDFVDDSKATNGHAAQASLLAYGPESVIWIAGGLPKGARFEDLVAKVRDRLAGVVVIGHDQEPWRDALAGVETPVYYVPADSAEPMQLAVERAFDFATRGNTVLLAPACASQDQFASYTDRGEAFQRAVRDLGGGNQ